jgi:hypothetical protein
LATMNYCELSDLSYSLGCAKEKLPSVGGGTIMLKFLIDYLKKNKKRLKVKRVALQDNSYKTCEKCRSTLGLATIGILTSGHTWYGRFGFRPFDPAPYKEIPDEIALKDYDENIKKMDTIKFKDFDLLKIIKDKLVTVNKKETKMLKKYSEFISTLKNKDVLLRKLLNQLSKLSCCFMSYIYLDIFKQLGLNDFRQKSFYLDL